MIAPTGRLQSKVALVTGGSKGIGKAIVERFLAEGATVAFTGSTREAGAALEQELQAAGLPARFFLCDGLSEEQVRATVAEIATTYGRLDIAVNNVGNTAPNDNPTAPIHEATLEGFDDTLERNLNSTFIGMKYQLEQMVKQGGGSICNTASMAGVRTSEGASAGYHAAKAAVIHLTRKAAIQYAKQNIRVNVVAPGATVTDRVLARWTRAEFDQLASVHPMGRAVTPEECAAAFLFLCSDDAAAITGLMIPIDGGWTAS
nr:SDR family NAD(P)-dependent oxidoreductase [Sphingomonas sp. CDS-1]